MKYVMGLIVAFALGTATYAQDTKSNEDCEDVSSSAKMEEQQSTSPDMQTDKPSGEVEMMYGDHIQYGAPEEGFSKMERMENGSVYYYTYPNSTTEGRAGNVYGNENGDISERGSVPDDANVNAETEQKRDEAEAMKEGITKEAEAEVAEEASESAFNMGQACSLNSILNSREGKFELKHEGDEEDLKMEREKDGDASIKYASENEYYNYKENKKGESEYTYSIMNPEGEVIEVVKNKDGSGDVFYHGHFENLDQAKVLNEGTSFEGVESVCNQ